MITQQTSHVPHRKAPEHHMLRDAALAALALVMLTIAVMVSRPAQQPAAQPTTSYVPGIVASAGQDITNYPRGYTDYLLNRGELTIRAPVVVSYVPGIVAPTGQDITNYPRGYTDYILPAQRPVMVSAPLGIVAPTGLDLTRYPRGYTDYVLPEP